MKTSPIAALLVAFAISVTSSLAVVELPVEVTALDTAAVTKSIGLNMPAGGNAATSLYLQVHNLRFGGQISVKVNSGSWVTLYNHTVTVLEPELSQGAVGGLLRQDLLRGTRRGAGGEPLPRCGQVVG